MWSSLVNNIANQVQGAKSPTTPPTAPSTDPVTSPDLAIAAASTPPPPSASPPAEILLIVFIHGFKGTDETFGPFPKRLQHMLAETLTPMPVECLVFPAYETKGELDKAVIRLSDWLTTLAVERENACGGGAGKAKIVLCGHSMGGLLAADTIRAFIETQPDPSAPLWPKIIGCVAFDTPFYGIHPFVVKNSVTKASEYATAATTLGSAVFGGLATLGTKQAASGSARSPTAENPPSSPTKSSAGVGWGKWAAIGGAALAAGAAAGGVYYKREELSQGVAWTTDHMKFVGNLWDEEALKRRVEEMIDIEEKYGVIFRVLYCLLPPKPPSFFESRTFIVPPKHTGRAKNYFSPTNNGIAPDEIDGHTSMFSPGKNDGYYRLGLTAAKIIQDAVQRVKEASDLPSEPKSLQDEWAS